MIHLQAKDFEGALVNLFPALDVTAKRRRPKDGVGARIRAFLKEEEGLISAVATGNILKNVVINGVSITDALYKFGRNALLHEGQLDPRLHFNDSQELQLGQNSWNLPSGYIMGMSLAVIVAPENAHEHIDDTAAATLFGQTLKINDLWGNKPMLYGVLSEHFQRPGPF